MKVLSYSLYEKVKDERDVKCPHKECPGLIVKVGGEIFKHPTPDYWEKTLFYRCNRNCKHIWKYFLTSFDF
jgi:hypothetical protein